MIEQKQRSIESLKPARIRPYSTGHLATINQPLASLPSTPCLATHQPLASLPSRYHQGPYIPSPISNHHQRVTVSIFNFLQLTSNFNCIITTTIPYTDNIAVYAIMGPRPEHVVRQGFSTTAEVALNVICWVLPTKIEHSLLRGRVQKLRMYLINVVMMQLKFEVSCRKLKIRDGDALMVASRTVGWNRRR